MKLVHEDHEQTINAFPWEETLGFLMGVLGWPAHAAWAATPREVGLGLRGRYGPHISEVMNAATLDVLMQEWPD